MPVRRLIPLALVLVILFLLGLGFYALLVGEISLIRVSIRGPVARAIGLVIIVATILSVPILLRGLVGLSLNLGH
jgi:hypothetical protein